MKKIHHMAITQSQLEYKIKIDHNSSKGWHIYTTMYKSTISMSTMSISTMYKSYIRNLEVMTNRQTDFQLVDSIPFVEGDRVKR